MSWILAYDGFHPEQEPLRETLCTLGNGYFATRGAGEESRSDGIHYPGTYLAGGYNRLASAAAGRTIYNEDLVNFPNWLPLSFRPAEGRWLNLAALEILEYRQELHLQIGLLRREMMVRDRAGRVTRIESRRIVHMDHPHFAAQQLRVRPENWSGPVDVRSTLDGSIINAGVTRYRSLSSNHLEVFDRDAVDSDGILLHVRTSQSRIEMAQASRTRVYSGDAELDVERARMDSPDTIGQNLRFDLEPGQEFTVEKVVALYTSRDLAATEAGAEAREAIGWAGRFEELLESHVQAWSRLWRRCDIEIEPAGEEQLALRIHVFHLLQTTSRNAIDLDWSVPARGLHGEAYRGHIFWDELFIFPFFNLRIPAITRTCLRYRYRRLEWARRLARRAGHAGAMYPWQSGSNGQEETQEMHLNPRTGKWGPDHSRRQRHVNLAIAYNIWRYCADNRDWTFMEFYGAEMILEISRFFAGLAHLSPHSGRFEIHGVMGPDEYHEKYPNSDIPGLRNNAYTNVMVVWLLGRAIEVLDRLAPERREEIESRIELRSAEVERWREITRRMLVPFHDDVISQFQGYETLDEFDWGGYRAKYGNIARLDRILKAEGDSPDHYRASKQADVLMLFYVLSVDEIRQIFEQLGYTLDQAAVRRTIDYYLKRTSHGSTLSEVVHAAVLAKIDPALSWQLFSNALRSDIADVQGGTTPEGVHLGLMSATLDVVLQQHAGVDTSGDCLRVDPRLPEAWQSVRFRLRHQGRWYELSVGKEHCKLDLDQDHLDPAEVEVQGRRVQIEPGSSYEWTPVAVATT